MLLVVRIGEIFDMFLGFNMIFVVFVVATADTTVSVLASGLWVELNDHCLTISLIYSSASLTRRWCSSMRVSSFSGVTEGRWKARVKYFLSWLKEGEMEVCLICFLDV